MPIDLVAVHQPPFVMEKWRVGSQGQLIQVECVVSYEGNIKKPRSTRMMYKATLGHEVPPCVEKSVQLQLKRASISAPWPQESQDSGINVECTCGSTPGSVSRTPTASTDLEKTLKFQRGSNISVEMGESSSSYSHIAKSKPKTLSHQPAGAWSDKGNTNLALGIGPYSGSGEMKIQKWPMAKDAPSRSPIVGMSTRNQKPQSAHQRASKSLESETSHNFARETPGRKNSGGKPRGKGRGHRQRQSELFKAPKNEQEVTDYRRSSSTSNPKK